MNYMTKMIATGLVMIVLLGFRSEAKCQTFNEWFKQKKTQKKYLIEQIAALQLYLKNLKQGYVVVKKGLNLVGEITGNSYSMDNIYLQSLLQVKMPIKNSDLNNSIITLESGIRKRLNILEERIHDNSTILSVDESAYLKKVTRKAESILSDQMAKAQKALTADEVQMTDAGRIEILKNVKNDLEELASFLGQADGELTRLIIQRRAENFEVQELNDLHQ
jgi:hypothetical protein